MSSTGDNNDKDGDKVQKQVAPPYKKKRKQPYSREMNRRLEAQRRAERERENASTENSGRTEEKRGENYTDVILWSTDEDSDDDDDDDTAKLSDEATQKLKL